MVVRAAVQADRYRVVGSIHFDALVGLDRQDFPTIGFYYAVQDRELGWQALGLQPTFRSRKIQVYGASCKSRNRIGRDHVHARQSARCFTLFN